MNFSGSNFWARGRHPAYLLSRKTEHSFLELLEIFKPGERPNYDIKYLKTYVKRVWFVFVFSFFANTHQPMP